VTHLPRTPGIAERLRRFGQKSPSEKRSAIMSTLAAALPCGREGRRWLDRIRLLRAQFRSARVNSRAKTIPSGLGDSAELLYGLVRSMKPEVCVEIGSARGNSACHIGLALKENGSGRLYAIDPHEQTDWNDKNAVNTLKEFMDNISAVGVGEQVSIIRSYSDAAARDWKLPIDLIFIDGDHSYEGVKRDWKLFLPHMRPFGIVVFHDTMWDLPPYEGRARRNMGVPQFVDELRQQGYQILTIERDYGLSLVQPVVGGRPLRMSDSGPTETDMSQTAALGDNPAS
jgi:predicted O-methyltransferase YrrM